MIDRWRILTGVLVVVAVLVGTYWLSNASPRIPSGAAATALGVASNPAAAGVPDAIGEPGAPGPPLTAQDCLDRLARPAGWLDLCWFVERQMNDADPEQDYYTLRLTGTVHGEAFPSGLRWLVLRARPDANAAVTVMGEWPGGAVYEGDCRTTTAAAGPLGHDVDATVCGRTTGEPGDSSTGTTGLRWTCAGCLLPMSADREVLLLVSVAVGEGTSPRWDIFADLGG